MSFFDADRQRRSERDFTFLEGVTARDWTKLMAYAETRSFSAGEILVAAGEADSSFYILTNGSVEVVQGGAVLSVIPRGSVFGEVAFFDGLARSATIRALEAGSAVRYSRQAVDTLAAWEPALAQRMIYDLGRALAMRFRAAEQRQSSRA